MKGIKRLNGNPAEQNVKNFLTATNALADQKIRSGESAEFLSARNAPGMYQKLMKMAMALTDPGHTRHNEVFNALQSELGRGSEAIDNMQSIGESFLRDSRELAALYVKNGLTPEKAVESAFNSLAGNPVFDHFGNLNLLAGQLYQEQTFIEAFQSYGDAFAVPLEPGATGLAKSRFRAPVESVTGSAKVTQGDINPSSSMRDDNNRTQIDLYNEFKDAITLDTVFSITQAMRDQVLGYAQAVSPALGGFILQNRYFGAGIKQVMKLAELAFVGGQRAAGNYLPGIGGSYGLLSDDIRLQLSDWDAASPSVATGADWRAAPTTLIQQIQNKLFLAPANQQLPASGDPALMYADLIRLFQLPAQQNVDFAPREWVLYVPSTWYALAVKYPGSGTFNKQLQEMVQSATAGKIVQKITVLPSSLLNYGADIGNGQSNEYNYMVLIAMGCRSENKPVIMPGQTAMPIISSENVSPAIMNFRSEYLFGGPMVMQYGGAFIMEFSKAS